MRINTSSINLSSIVDDLLTNLSNLNENVAMLRVSWYLQGMCGGEFFEYLQCSPGQLCLC